ncbi:MAG: SpoVR family protein [Thermus sp.]
MNTEPVHAYLLRGNTLLAQKVVMAHVYAHATFSTTTWPSSPCPRTCWTRWPTTPPSWKGPWSGMGPGA